MSSLMETIMGQLAGGGAIDQIGNRLGKDQATTGAATGAAVTALLGALARNASKPDGAASLDAALAKDHDGSILDNLGGFLQAPEQGPGEGILKHILGNRRGAVESNLGRATGLDSNATGDLMKMLAPVVLGALGKQKRSQGLDPGSLAGMLGHERKSLERAQPQGMSALSGLLDTDGDGDVDMGDLAKHGMGLLGKFMKR